MQHSTYYLDFNAYIASEGSKLDSVFILACLFVCLCVFVLFCLRTMNLKHHFKVAQINSSYRFMSTRLEIPTACFVYKIA